MEIKSKVIVGIKNEEIAIINDNSEITYRILEECGFERDSFITFPGAVYYVHKSKLMMNQKKNDKLVGKIFMNASECEEEKNKYDLSSNEEEDNITKQYKFFAEKRLNSNDLKMEIAKRVLPAVASRIFQSHLIEDKSEDTAVDISIRLAEKLIKKIYKP
jgi:hypothetical protein